MLTDRCFQTLQGEIIRGELLPGAKLKVKELATRLGMGATPVREALSRLLSTGLVKAEDGKGFRVVEVNARDTADLRSVLFQVESLALSQAIERGDEQWESRVAAALYQLRKVEMGSPSYEKWAEANSCFHRVLVSGCGSRTLLEIRDLLWQRMEQTIWLQFKAVGSLEMNHEEHALLAKAILERDQALALKLLKAHILEEEA